MGKTSTVQKDKCMVYSQNLTERGTKGNRTKGRNYVVWLKVAPNMFKVTRA